MADEAEHCSQAALAQEGGLATGSHQQGKPRRNLMKNFPSCLAANRDSAEQDSHSANLCQPIEKGEKTDCSTKDK